MSKSNVFSRFEIRSIAIEYAYSEDEVSAPYFCRVYGITEKVFYNVIKRAIVESIIDVEAANLIAQKASRNSLIHGGEGGRMKSIRKHERLMSDRERFEFTIKEKKQYAIAFASSSYYIDIKTFAIQNAMTTELLSKTLVSAIANGYVDDVVARQIYTKFIQHSNGEEAIAFWKSAFDDRKKNEHKNNRSSKKGQQHRQVTCGRFCEVRSEVDELRKQHRDFVLKGIKDFGIPDEIGEQLSMFDVMDIN